MIMTSMQDETPFSLAKLRSLVRVEHILPLVEEDMAVIELGEPFHQLSGC